MRQILVLCVVVVALAVASPVQAQLRTDARAQSQLSMPRLSDAGGVLGSLFNPNTFRMAHSYTFSAGSMGGQGYSLGVYTNSMMFQFSPKLAARVDVGVAHSPFGNGLPGMRMDGQANNLNVFLQNAEIAYRPNDSFQVHFSVRQSPFGGYMSPYGMYGAHPMGSAYSARISHGSDDLFWNSPR